MPRCSNCGAALPEACPACPPRVIDCPGCGRQVLLAPADGAMHDEIIRQHKEKYK